MRSLTQKLLSNADTAPAAPDAHHLMHTGMHNEKSTIITLSNVFLCGGNLFMSLFDPSRIPLFFVSPLDPSRIPLAVVDSQSEGHCHSICPGLLDYDSNA